MSTVSFCVQYTAPGRERSDIEDFSLDFGYTNPRSMTMATNLCHYFQQRVAENADELAITNADGSVRLTWSEYGAQVRRASAALASEGLNSGDVVAIMLSNRPEFHIVDAGVMHLGAIAFSVYNTSAPEQIDYLFSNSRPKIVVTERQFENKVREALAMRRAEGDTFTRRVVVIDSDEKAEGLEEFLDQGADDFDFDAAWQAVDPDDILTLIYTSGTTGNPKGVELTHANLLYQLGVISAVVGDLSDGRVISYLPDAHLINRWICQYAPMYFTIEVTDVDDPKILVDVLGKVHPTFFVAVPMLWYKIVGKVKSTIAAEEGIKGTLLRWATGIGARRAEARVAGTSPSRRDALAYAVADRLVLSTLREKLGMDQLTAAVSGAAPIDASTLVFLSSLGIDVLEAWGLSETSAVTTVNPAAKPRFGTVGKAIPGTEVALGEDGEVLVRGGGVMRGYHRDPVYTAASIDEYRWVHTGDIGELDDEGYLTIIDRKKELIINDGGKNISPANIEGALKAASTLIGSAVAVGDRRPHISALITLDPDAATEFAARSEVDASDPADLAMHPEVRSAIASAVEAANARLSRVEHVRTWEILPTFWAPGSDELTPTLKLRRAPIARKYADQIDALYAR